MKDTGVAIKDVRGMFVLPDAFLDEVKTEQEKETIRANGYAALRELEFYNGLSAEPFSTRAWGKCGTDSGYLRGQPFSVCYLFSNNNGKPLRNVDEVYDLLADALAFATGGGELASRIRSCWSNAQGQVYNNSLVYKLPAGDDGDLRKPGEDGVAFGSAQDQHLLYKRRWSIRFSSMGTASVTMKLPELRRLAAVRLVRRWLAAEAAALTAEADAAQAEARGRPPPPSPRRRPGWPRPAGKPAGKPPRCPGRRAKRRC